MEPKDISKSGLGQRLRQEREHRGMSQARLGELVGWHERTVSSFETGTTKYPDREKLVAIAKHLGLPSAPLLEEAGYTATDDELREARSYQAGRILFADVWWEADEATRRSLTAQLKGLRSYQEERRNR